VFEWEKRVISLVLPAKSKFIGYFFQNGVVSLVEVLGPEVLKQTFILDWEHLDLVGHEPDIVLQLLFLYDEHALVVLPEVDLPVLEFAFQPLTNLVQICIPNNSNAYFFRS